MYKTLTVVSLLSFSMASAFAQSTNSTINKCDNGKDPIVYTEFDCPEGYEAISDSWLSETNMTNAEKFGDESRNHDEITRDVNGRAIERDLE